MGKELVRGLASAGRSPGVRAAPWGGSREARGSLLLATSVSHGPLTAPVICGRYQQHLLHIPVRNEENPRPAQYCTTCSPFLGPNMAEPIAIKTYQIRSHYF